MTFGKNYLNSFQSTYLFTFRLKCGLFVFHADKMCETCYMGHELPLSFLALGKSTEKSAQENDFHLKGDCAPALFHRKRKIPVASSYANYLFALYAQALNYFMSSGLA